MFNNNFKIWKRFVDDCFGMFMGKEKLFRKFHTKLVTQFQKFDLELTSQQSKEAIVILDLEIYVMGNQLHTKENRKETASSLYLRFGSAHPQYTFKGIVKSQMYRLRRLCSREKDFNDAIDGLKKRCLNSGYDKHMVEEMLKQASNLKREINPRIHTKENNNHKIKWITLSNSYFEKDMKIFADKINSVLKDNNFYKYWKPFIQ